MRDEAVQQPRKGHGRLSDSRAAGSAGGRLQEGTRTPPPGGGIYVAQPTAVPANLVVFYQGRCVAGQSGHPGHRSRGPGLLYGSRRSRGEYGPLLALLLVTSG